MPLSRLKFSGAMYMLLSSASFSIMALCVKLAAEHLPSLEIVFFRSLIGTLMTLWVIFRKHISFLGRQRKLMFFRGVCGFLALSLYFYTIPRLPLGTAVLLNYSSPIFTSLIAVLFLKERPSLFLVTMTILSFFGIYLLAGGHQVRGDFKIISIGLISAFFAACSYTFIRAVKYRESPLTIMFYFSAISTVGSSIFLLKEFIWPDWRAWLYLSGVGVGSFYGQLWLTIALRRAPASLLGPLSYLTPLLSFIFGVVFFGEHLASKEILGALLVAGGGTGISMIETRRKKSV